MEQKTNREGVFTTTQCFYCDHTELAQIEKLNPGSKFKKQQEIPAVARAPTKHVLVFESFYCLRHPSLH